MREGLLGQRPPGRRGRRPGDRTRHRGQRPPLVEAQHDADPGRRPVAPRRLGGETRSSDSAAVPSADATTNVRPVPAPASAAPSSAGPAPGPVSTAVFGCARHTLTAMRGSRPCALTTTASSQVRPSRAKATATEGEDGLTSSAAAPKRSASARTIPKNPGSPDARTTARPSFARCPSIASSAGASGPRTIRSTPGAGAAASTWRRAPTTSVAPAGTTGAGSPVPVPITVITPASYGLSLTAVPPSGAWSVCTGRWLSRAIRAARGVPPDRPGGNRGNGRGGTGASGCRWPTGPGRPGRGCASRACAP